MNVAENDSPGPVRWQRLGWASAFGAALLASAATLLWTLHGCQPAPSGPPASPWFEDITDRVGLDFVQDPGPTGAYFMPQSMGSGAALFDFNRDGRLDLYLLQNAGPDSSSTNRLYRQEPDGRFTDVSKGSGLDIAGYNMGVAVGDVNNDGFPDVLVTQYGGVKLFLNNGDGTFTDATREAGLEHSRWGASAAFVDYDRDGWLDLVVVNYVAYDPTRPCSNSAGLPDYCTPTMFPGAVANLYHNLGGIRDGRPGAVHFEDVTQASGLGSLPGPGLGVLCADFDGDGWPDIFVADDQAPNRLWINQHDGTFKDEAVTRGVAFNRVGQAEAGMGAAMADVDGDGLVDLYVTHLTWETNTLWKQVKRGRFVDATAAVGLDASTWRGTGFGTVFADFDLKGSPDLAVVNGRVLKGPAAPVEGLDPFWRPYAERNQLFVNDGTGRFRDVSANEPAFCGTAGVSRGLACGDIDGDGALDLLTTCIAGRARLYHNVAPRRGHWLLVEAVEPMRGGRAAIGAEIVVRAGERRWTGWISPGSSYLCSNDARAHFGLGPVERVDGIRVRWPEGDEEDFPGGAVDQRRVLRKGEGEKAADRPVPAN